MFLFNGFHSFIFFFSLIFLLLVSTSGVLVAVCATVVVVAMATVLAPSNSEHAAVELDAAQVGNGHGSTLVTVILDKGVATVLLVLEVDNVSKVLQHGHQIVRAGEWRQVTNVDGGLPVGSLMENHVVAVGINHTHGGRVARVTTVANIRVHDVGVLLLLRGPIASDGSAAQPFTVHSREGLLGVGTLAEGNKSVPTAAASGHVPHDARLNHAAKYRECLGQEIVIDFRRQVADENVEIFGILGGLLSLISPIDFNFLCSVSFKSMPAIGGDTYTLVQNSAVQRLEGQVSANMLVVFNEGVVKTPSVLIGENLDAADIAGDLEQL